MIAALLESRFSYGDTPRLSYFWDNPNHAAAVIAALIPIFWVLEEHGRKKALNWALFTVEQLAVLALTLTFSRGGAAAWLTAWSLLLIFQLREAKKGRLGNVRQIIYRGTTRIVIFIAFSVAVGFSSRVASSANDDSVGNRLELWAGGVKMMYASPVDGWGRGNSGVAYMHWYQDTAATVQHQGMVNSYLHLGVEFGIPLLALVLTLCLLPFIAASSTQSSLSYRSRLTRCLACSIAAFLVAAFFSTLWNLPGVNWVPIVLSLAVFLTLLDKASNVVYANAIKRSVIVTGGICLGLIIYGHFLTQGDNVKVKKLHDGCIALQGTTVVTQPPLWIFPDYQVMGSLFGKNLRKDLNLFINYREVVVVSPGKFAEPPTNAIVVLLGSRAKELKKIVAVNDLIVVAPTAPAYPIGKLTAISHGKIVLPEFDDVGFSSDWSNSVINLKNWTASVMRGTSQDMANYSLSQLCLGLE